MKVKSIIMVEPTQGQGALLSKQYTRNIARILASQFSLQEINELIENLMMSDILLIKMKQFEYTKQIL
ncbi:hypothetical protein [Clostridium sp.]|jgi:hypothetical protein|uniref:hypothetical protein n=1 Tax=Clostridium sp. TaxID=1506 RepID=UPI003EEB0351